MTEKRKTASVVDKELAEVLADLVPRVRLHPIVTRAWERLLTAIERRRIENDPHVDGDIVQIWGKTKGLSFPEAVLDLAWRCNLLSTPDYYRLMEKCSPGCKFGAPRGRPSWDKDRGELRFDGEVIKRVRRSRLARNVETVLDAFEECGWPPRIDDPLHGGRNQQRLHETIRSLNQRLERIRFRGDGSGAGIRWELA